MKTSVYTSTYSLHFKFLTGLGAWTINSKNNTIVTLYVVHKTIMTVIVMTVIVSLIVDLYMVFGDIKETTWNLCGTVLLAGTIAKLYPIFHNNHRIFWLRKSLHEDMESRSTPEDIFIHNSALKELKLIRLAFYGTITVFAPIWLVSFYMTRYKEVPEFPYPIRFPFKVHLDDVLEYTVLFAIVGAMGIVGLFLVIETELAMFSILVQISREYRVLVKDIPQLNDVYDENYQERETNPELRNIITKQLIRKLSKRQQELLEYTKVFDDCFSGVLLLQFFVVSLLVIVSLMQCILMSGDLSNKAAFLLGYSALILTDLFFLCLFATRLSSQCNQVGEVVYDCLWYKMEPAFQKDLRMMILRAQNPPVITAGKIVELDLNAFMHTVTNIYSWLTLFRQLEVQQNN